MSKIEYLRVIVNSECNLSCFFCHNEGEECKYFVREKLDVNILEKMIMILVNNGIKKIKFLGGEPTLYKDLPRLIEKINSNELDISIITNGIASKNTLQRFINAGVNRINISLHGFNKDVFKEVTGGTLQQLNQTLETIDYLNNNRKLGKVNYVLLKGVNECEFIDVLRYVNDKNLVLDVLNYLDTDSSKIIKYYYSFEEIMAFIKAIYEIDKIKTYINQFSLPSTRIYIKNGGVINLKTTSLNSVHFLKSCDSCGKKEYCTEGISAIRLTTEGIIKPCIFRDDNILDLKELMKNKSFEEVDELVKEYFENL